MTTTSIRCIDGTQPPARVAPKLWQSGYPLNGEQLAAEGFDTIVLCAIERQVRTEEEARRLFPGVRVICTPFDDSADRAKFVGILQMAGLAAQEVAKERAEGRRVLVTCRQGRNRSGLVSALALVQQDGLSGAEAMALVKQARLHALTNPLFADYLAWKKARPRLG